MRVIGGAARGRAIRAPKSEKVRPTADRVREAMFDALYSLTRVEGASVVDLFAGSGALGIEARSRGASSVTFVERDRLVAAQITDNLVSTGLFDELATKVIVSDAASFLASSHRHFDLGFCDPPYRFEDWTTLLSALMADVVVCESAGEVELPENYLVYRVYRYGTTLVTVATSASFEVTGSRR